MEAGGSGSRQSRPSSASNLERYDNPYHPPPPPRRESHEKPFRDGPAMATAALINPSTSYHGHPTSFSSGYPHSTPGPSIAGMISPVEPRRHSDESGSSTHRQSLPSISEVISGAKPGPYSSAQQPPLPEPQQSFPSSFTSSAAPTRPYQDPAPEKQSPRPVHSSSAYPPRQEPLPPFNEPPRPPYAGRPPPPPLSSYSGAQPSPPIKPDQPREIEAKPADPHQPNGVYQHQAPNQPLYPPPHPSQLPPGQMPLPAAYPVSPRHPGPALPSPFESRQGPSSEDGAEYSANRGQYDRTLSRHLDAWGYQDCLIRIAASSRTVFNFAEAYGKIAAEQHSAQPIPDRLPTDREVSEMLSNLDYIRQSLESVRTMVQDSVMNERARMIGKAKTYDDEDTPMYDGLTKNAYGISEVKKRRGRAAPPGRCHSCNRIDTPEWRRGPDGARTLCNACGLHYAKLERKRQLENRSIRPKPSDERS